MPINDLSAEQLAAIFDPQPTLEDRLHAYLQRVAMDHLRRAVGATTLAEFRAEARAYKLLNRGLIEAGVWPEG